MLLESARADDILSDILRKVAKPQAGEEIYTYAAVLISICVLYVIYKGLADSGNKVEIEQLTLGDIVSKEPKGSKNNELTGIDKMLMQIDQMGIIEKELNGMLTKDAFLLIRNLISSGA
jgi:hypothetical protein